MNGKTRRSVVVLAVVAMIAALLAIPIAPAGAASAACDGVPSAGFTDLGSYSAETVAAVDCIYYYGITKGTSATTYGPTGDVSRWQMALFLTRKLTAAGVTLPSGAPQGFADISSFDAETQTAINQLAQLSITQGTSATTFDPNGIVSRWQMALFITRQLTAAGITLPSGASQGFTDIGTLDAATQTAINQLAQLGISKGTTATTYDPMGNVNRWQMALFLSRDLDAMGVATSGLGLFVYKVDTANNAYYVADPAACSASKVTYKSTDSFFVDGTPATMAAFEANLDSLDVIGALAAVAFNNGKANTTTGIHNLTTAVKVTSGIVATSPGGGVFTFEEPYSGNTLATYTAGATLYEFYAVDGVSTNLLGFTNALGVGDTVAITGGNGSTAAKAKTFSLTTGSVSGSVYDTAGIDIETACQIFVVGVPAGTDTITIDGVADTLANFNTELSEGDMLTYSYAAAKGTWALTNAKPPVLSGEAAANVVGTTFDIYQSGSTTVPGVDWTTFTTLKVNGAVATTTDFANHLTAGDQISWQVADTVTSTTSMLALTDAAYTGAPAVITPAGHTLSVYSFGASGSQLDTQDYEATTVVGLTIGTGGAVKYMVDGASATEAQFEAAVAFAIANAGGNVSVAKDGINIVWSATTS
jgi:hypothetical protein